MQNVTSTLQNNLTGSYKGKHTHTILPRNPAPGYLTKSKGDTSSNKACMSTFRAIPSIIPQTGNHTNIQEPVS